MTNEEILQKAIEKAEKNGWDCFGYKSVFDPTNDPYIRFKYIHTNGSFGLSIILWKEDQDGRDGYSWSLKDIIFYHDFAKAFWGVLPHNIIGAYESRECTECKAYDPQTDKCWQHHLQKMVIEEDPIKYLEKFL